MVGIWRDIYGNHLIIQDPDLASLNEARLHQSVPELELWSKSRNEIKTLNVGVASDIKKHSGIDVHFFCFSPKCLVGVLSAIRTDLEDKLYERDQDIKGIPTLPGSDESGKIAMLEPNFYGVGFRLRPLFRRISAKVKNLWRRRPK